MIDALVLLVVDLLVRFLDACTIICRDMADGSAAGFFRPERCSVAQLQARCVSVFVFVSVRTAADDRC